MKIKFILICLLGLCGDLYAQDYTTSIVFPANYQIGDYVEFLKVVPIDAGSSGYYQVSISYTRNGVAAASSHLASISHYNPAVWREVGMVNGNPYVVAGQYNFTIDCNTEYTNARFRVRATNTYGASAPIAVNITVHAINNNSSWTPLNNAGNDLTINTFLPMTNEWSLYTGNDFNASGANLAIKAIENGSVGIGTAHPQSKLHLGGTTSDVFSIGTTDYGGNAGQALAGIRSGEIAGGYGGTMEFQTLTWGQAPYALTTKMIIQGNTGNVGIGVLDPGAYKLGVNGTIHAKAVVVDLLGWADYVFRKDYQLMPLVQVSSYIGQNRHLPGLPSEKEVESNGLDLGEMNKLLTKKVEELTLYLIEEDKDKAALKKAFSKQQIQIEQLMALVAGKLKTK